MTKTVRKLKKPKLFKEPKNKNAKRILTDQEINSILTMSAYRLSVEKMAAILGMHEPELSKILLEDDRANKAFKEGRAKASAAVSQMFYEKAKSGSTPELLFWMKTQEGMQETSHYVIDAGIDVKKSSELSPEDRAARIKELYEIVKSTKDK
jgi:hypothetical protein